MTTENRLLDVSYEAAEDLSNDQYRFVVLTTDMKVRRPDAQNEIPCGILQNAPTSGKPAVVRMPGGVSKLEAGAALTGNTFVRLEYISATDAGKGVPLVTNEGYAAAHVVEGADAEGELASVVVMQATPGI